MIKVEVKLGRTVDRAFYVRERDIDLVRMLVGFAKQGTPATAAKGAVAVRGGGVATELPTARVNLELSWWHCEPRHEGSPMVSAAHRAVAVTTEEAR